jgi:hypothetical protein
MRFLRPADFRADLRVDLRRADTRFAALRPVFLAFLRRAAPEL